MGSHVSECRVQTERHADGEDDRELRAVDRKASDEDADRDRDGRSARLERAAPQSGPDFRERRSTPAVARHPAPGGGVGALDGERAMRRYIWAPLLSGSTPSTLS